MKSFPNELNQRMNKLAYLRNNHLLKAARILKLIWFWSFLFVSCASVSQKLDPNVFYKRDIQISINGKKAIGAVVVPRAESYHFEIKTPGRLDLFTLTTCHREETFEALSTKVRSFDFKPISIELGQLACPVHLGGYEKIRGRHSWAFIDFEHPSLLLRAEIKCNGVQRNTSGVSLCQAKVGLIQEIKFKQPVIWPKKLTCIELSSDDEKTFRFKMPRGECTSRFLSKTGKKLWHRFTTLGYEKILIRGD